MQWLSIRLHAKPLTDYFSHLMYRQYISDNSVWGGGRPQFLFAEPSYIGMHLFGILLPLMWLMRGRDRIYAKRLRDLIVTYAVGAVLMQAGTRIVIDSVVALLIALVARTDWHDGARRVRGMLQILGACALGLLGVLADSRLSAIAENGAEGDGSFFARIYLLQESEQGRHVIEIDARPSDSIAMAIQQQCPIFVRREVWEQAEDASWARPWRRTRHERSYS